MKIQPIEWMNVRERLPMQNNRVLVKCGESELPARRIGWCNHYWLYDSGFKQLISEYDLWRPI